jgi:lipopolysaccharide transport system permease protein
METVELNSLTGTAPQSAVIAPVERQQKEQEVLRLVPARGWRISRLAEVWRSRELLMFLAWRDIKVRYKQTMFGAAWAVLQPLLMMLAFSVFFLKMAGVSTGHYKAPLFFYSGLLPWTFFATVVATAGNSVVSSERLVTKIYFPRLLIPLASVSVAAADFCVAMGLMAILMIYYHTWGGMQMLLAPLFLLAIAAMAAGIGTFISALTVRYRDVKYCLPFLLQIWMFATPSVYMDVTSSKISAWKVILNMNPMTGLVLAFRSACLGGPIPWANAVPAMVMGIFMFFLGCLYFQRIEDRFADEI